MKKFAIVFLSLCLVVSLPFAAHANIVTATGKYLINAVKHVPGAVRVDATNTATGAKHVIKHGISSADLGKGIGAGIVGMGVATGVGFAFQAITGLALDAVDWVMDKENNQIKWKEKGVEPSYIWFVNNPYMEASTPDALCRKILAPLSPRYEYLGTQTVDENNAACISNDTASGLVSPRHNIYKKSSSAPVPEYKTIPFDVLAAKTLDLADAGNVAAQKTIEDYVTNLAKDGELDNELDNATDITEPENPEEPNPDEPQQCPSGTVKVDNVCVKIPDSDGDEPLFCDSSEFTKKVCDWIDWTQTEHDEPESDAGKVDIKDKAEDLSIDNDRIDFSNQCPAPTPINTSVGGFPVSTELNYQPLCDFFTMLNPFVVGMGGISSALIIAGGARRG